MVSHKVLRDFRIMGAKSVQLVYKGIAAQEESFLLYLFHITARQFTDLCKFFCRRSATIFHSKSYSLHYLAN